MLAGSTAYLFYQVYFEKQPLGKKHDVEGQEEVKMQNDVSRRKDVSENSKQESSQKDSRHSKETPSRRRQPQFDEEDGPKQVVEDNKSQSRLPQKPQIHLANIQIDEKSGQDYDRDSEEER